MNKMKLQKMRLIPSLDLLKKNWLNIVHDYDLSISDSFTDGFWDGRLWAAMRIMDEFPDIDKNKIIKIFEISDNEIKKCENLEE